MYQLLTPPLVKRRLVLRSGPVGLLHDYALIFWFRTWLAEEDYLSCQAIVRELGHREASGRLPVALIVDGLRDKFTGKADFSGLNGLLDAWVTTYPSLFSERAGRQWLLKRHRYAPAAR